MAKSFLVEYGESRKVVTLKETDDVESRIMAVFNLEHEQNVKIIIQQYNADWENWIDTEGEEYYYPKYPTRQS